MQREYLMLMQGEKSLGAVKIEGLGEGIKAEITMDAALKLNEGEVLKAYLSSPSERKNRYIGVLEGYHGIFELKDAVAPIGIVITKKDTLTGKEVFCCLCAEEGKLNDVKNCFDGNETAHRETESVFAEGRDEGVYEFQREYMQRAEDNLKEIFKDFVFEKISGYYLRNNSRIIEYVMSGNGVHKQIMTYGHYYFAAKTEQNETEFIVAVPGSKNDENPFENCREYAFEIGDKGFGDEKYFCVRAGKDKDGEYFCRKK